MVASQAAFVVNEQVADTIVFRDTVKLQRHLGDDAVRALADEQPSQVVARRVFLAAQAGFVIRVFGITALTAITLSFMVP